jgi:hypothetical protein
MAEWEGQIANARRRLASPPQAMTTRNVAALAGDFCRAEVARYEADPGTPFAWDTTRDLLIDRLPEVPDEEVDELHYPRPRPTLPRLRGFGPPGRIVADPDALRRTAQ